MYDGERNSPTFYIIIPLNIGPGLSELHRIPVPRTSVNKCRSRERGAALEASPLSHSLVPFGLGGVDARYL
jgi:hypothetical protein